MMCVGHVQGGTSNMGYAHYDPLEPIRNMGYRIVWMEDFDYRVYIVDGVGVILIDHQVPRQDAADCLIGMVSLPSPDLDQREVS